MCPQFVSSPIDTCRTLTCWMYLSTEMNQGLNYFLIRFAAFGIPFLKSYQGPRDLKIEQSSVKWLFSSSFQQAPFLHSTGHFGAPGGTSRHCDPPPTWTHKHLHLQSYATSRRHLGVSVFRSYPHCAAQLKYRKTQLLAQFRSRNSN